jgi:hypothetical protein
MLEYVAAELGGQILIERPAQGHVEDLHPPADTQDGHPAPQSRLEACHLERVPLGDGGTYLGDGPLAVAARFEVGTPAQQKSV